MRMLLPFGLMLCLLASAAPAQEAQPAAEPLTVKQFLTRYAAIKAQKDKAKAAADSVALIRPLGESAKRYKLQIEAQNRAGERPRACPRKGSKDSFSFDELATHLLELPATVREGPLEPAFFAFLDKRNPCPVV